MYWSRVTNLKRDIPSPSGLFPYQLEIVDRWSARIPSALTMKIWMTSVTLTFELLTSWALFVPHMNMIHEIGNEPDTACGMDRQMDRWMDRSETNMPHNFVVWGGMKMKWMRSILWKFNRVDMNQFTDRWTDRQLGRQGETNIPPIPIPPQQLHWVGV